MFEINILNYVFIMMDIKETKSVSPPILIAKKKLRNILLLE